MAAGQRRFPILAAGGAPHSGSVAFGRRATVPGLGRQTDWLTGCRVGILTVTVTVDGGL